MTTFEETLPEHVEARKARRSAKEAYDAETESLRRKYEESATHQQADMKRMRNGGRPLEDVFLNMAEKHMWQVDRLMVRQRGSRAALQLLSEMVIDWYRFKLSVLKDWTKVPAFDEVVHAKLQELRGRVQDTELGDWIRAAESAFVNNTIGPLLLVSSAYIVQCRKESSLKAGSS